MKHIVISGIGLFEGGPLSVYYDCLQTVKQMKLYLSYQITAFVHKRELFQEFTDIVQIIELPDARKCYFLRAYYEFVYFYQFSKKNHIDIWLSLQDITPNVIAERKYTYCHNSLPFMKKNIRNARYSPKVVFFSYIYKYIYRINIRAAAAVIVQQDWLRQEFLKRYPVADVIVARPEMMEKRKIIDKSRMNKQLVFIYAAYPRFFKNYEVILQAAKMMESKGIYDFEVWLTIDGSENKYACELKDKYNELKTIRWMGLMPRDELIEKYGEADCMIFPSMLETWGLPISEFKETGKPMILADLPYAHEALAEYDKAVFFDPKDKKQLARLMKMAVNGKQFYQRQEGIRIIKPYANNWGELFHILLLDE